MFCVPVAKPFNQNYLLLIKGNLLGLRLLLLQLVEHKLKMQSCGKHIGMLIM